jgi:O-antigen/teichoic acid export membrane protein
MSNSLQTTQATLVSGAFALLDKSTAVEAPVIDVAHDDLKRRTARGAVVSTVAQVATFVLRTGSMMILARVLVPRDFGLVGMVTAFTGFLGLFKDAGLSMATVQRASITHAQTSTLFWMNVGLGWLLAGLVALAAPVLASFYSEPRLLWVTIALGSSFIFYGAGAQHRAILQRGMRFAALAVIDIVSLLLSIGVAIGMALAGEGYWALVISNITPSAAGGLGAWLVTRWIPGRPQRRSDIRSMLVFGGTMSLVNTIGYFAYNVDKVLIGRFWGAAALGLYGRAYQLVNLPTDNLSSAISSVAFPALSRVQNEPARLRSYFLKGYSFFLSLVVPVTVACALFPGDIIRVCLGPKWHEAAGIFRLLSPAILAFALINPFGWLLYACGQVRRSLGIALVVAPTVILGYVAGLRNGPHGVAIGYSLALVLLAGPLIVWAKRGTSITSLDVLRTIGPIFLSIATGVAVLFAAGSLLELLKPALLRLSVKSFFLFGTYVLMLLFVMKQKRAYAELLSMTGLWPACGRREKVRPG